jgi:hypothetical protein
VTANALADLVAQIAEGRRTMKSDDVRALIAAGHTREQILDALVAAAAEPKASRRLHRALSVLRDAR